MVTSSPTAMSLMLTRTTLPPMPTFGSHEWFTRIITPSYSPVVTAARKWSPVIGNAEFLIAAGRFATAARSTTWTIVRHSPHRTRSDRALELAERAEEHADGGRHPAERSGPHSPPAGSQSRTVSAMLGIGGRIALPAAQVI